MSNKNNKKPTYRLALEYKSKVADKNKTLFVVLFQTFASIKGTDNDALEPVAWIIAEVTDKQPPVSVEYQETYNVAIVDYFDQDEIGVIKSSQILPTELGRSWFLDHVAQYDKNKIKPANPNHLVITNNSISDERVGVGMYGKLSLLLKLNAIQRRENELRAVGGKKEDPREIKGLPVNSKVDFEVSPQYYLGVFEKIEVGQLISTAKLISKPAKVEFPIAIFNATATIFDLNTGKDDILYDITIEYPPIRSEKL
ncbi:10237_t:CDS:2 [Ambispora gerdemannii]|uniref:10237_t:CDS:1 n=1 Tax=Ambispora gerdemannii TaxID=144530 RepID=A0A9N8WQ45_9GLOM|nr:10237_t:CDS:2 [Ambispora gerdemannii]